MSLVQSNVYPSNRATQSKDYWDACRDRVKCRSVAQRVMAKKVAKPESDYEKCMRLARVAWAVGAHREAGKLRDMARIMRDGCRARVCFPSKGGGRVGSFG